MSAPRTRAEEAMRAVGRLREALHDLERCDVEVASSVNHAIAALGTGPLVLSLVIAIRVHLPDDPAP